jgi:hypothetical protein
MAACVRKVYVFTFLIFREPNYITINKNKTITFHWHTSIRFSFIFKYFKVFQVSQMFTYVVWLFVLFIFNKISLLFHLLFLYLTCACPYSCNLMLTATCMCRSYIISILRVYCIFKNILKMKWQINFAYYNTLYIPACVTDLYELRIHKWLGISFTTVSRNIFLQMERKKLDNTLQSQSLVSRNHIPLFKLFVLFIFNRPYILLIY